MYFSIETLQVRRDWNDTLKVLKGKTANQISGKKKPSNNEVTIKNFSEKKIRESYYN